jgi:signal transduction histidine kinase
VLSEPRLGDAALAALLTVFGLFELWHFGVEPAAVAVPATLLSGAALAWRRSAPLLVAAVALGSLAVESLLGVSLQKQDSPLLIALVALYTAAAYLSLRDAVAAYVIAAVCIGIATEGSSTNGHSDFAFTIVVATTGWLVGRGMHGRVRQTTELKRRTEHLERERAAAVAEERRRIARDLHDVIAHSVGVMVVQAGAAEDVYARDPPAVLGHVRAIQDTGRAALAEMSRLLGLLRADGAEIGLAPQPRLDELPALAAQTTSAGLPVDLVVEGTARELPLGVDLSMYRIAQEALTNARKHCSGGRATIVVRYGPSEVELRVDNDGEPVVDGGGGGHGLIGMRERVAVFGGSLEAGPRANGGFRIVALLPTGGAG